MKMADSLADFELEINEVNNGHVAALVRSHMHVHMNGLKPFERTIQQTTEIIPLSPKTKQPLQ